MKCPKCGYNSFEHLSACKKCSASLDAFKELHGIKPIILPASSLLQKEAPGYPAEPMAGEPKGEVFSWDMSGTSSPETDNSPFGSFAETADEIETTGNDLPFSFSDVAAPSAPDEGAHPPVFGDFSFDDIIAPPTEPPPTDTDNDMTSFAGLLESTVAAAQQPDAEPVQDFSLADFGGFEEAAAGSSAEDSGTDGVFGEASETKSTPEIDPPVDFAAFDALFSDEEVPEKEN